MIKLNRINWNVKHLTWIVIKIQLFSFICFTFHLIPLKISDFTSLNVTRNRLLTLSNLTAINFPDHMFGNPKKFCYLECVHSIGVRDSKSERKMIIGLWLWTRLRKFIALSDTKLQATVSNARTRWPQISRNEWHFLELHAGKSI